MDTPTLVQSDVTYFHIPGPLKTKNKKEGLGTRLGYIIHSINGKSITFDP